jgi:hypothetical protein
MQVEPLSRIRFIKEPRMKRSPAFGRTKEEATTKYAKDTKTKYTKKVCGDWPVGRNMVTKKEFFASLRLCAFA